MPTPFELEVVGRMPSYLHGNLYRIGPGLFDITHADGLPAERRHWFDGIGIVYKFALDASRNTISFMSRVCSPEVVRAIEATPKASYKELTFGGTQCTTASPLAKLRHFLLPPTRDPVSGVLPVNINVTVERLPGLGRLVARTDLSAGTIIDPETLVPVSRFSFSEVHVPLRGPISAAHSAHDATTGESFNFVTGDWRDMRRYRVFRLADGGEATVLADIRAPPGGHVHSLALTERFVVVCITPWRVNALGMLASFQMEPNIRFDETARSKFYVVSRGGDGLVAEYDCPAMVAFHYVNAFETGDGDEVVVDTCRYGKSTTLERFYLDELMAGSAGEPAKDNIELVRYALVGLEARQKDGLLKGVAEERDIGRHGMEFPCVSPKVKGRPYRFAYGLYHDDDLDDIPFNSLVKVDLETKETLIWQDSRCSVGEMSFVPDPNDDAEDAGSLVSIAIDACSSTSFLLVLEARTMKEVCRAYSKEKIPQALHGTYISKEDLSEAT